MDDKLEVVTTGSKFDLLMKAYAINKFLSKLDGPDGELDKTFQGVEQADGFKAIMEYSAELIYTVIERLPDNSPNE